MNVNSHNPLSPIIKLTDEIKKCQDAGAISATVIMVYVAIDSMAFLSMPEWRTKQNQNDFIAWVNMYLKASPESVYQYDGRDVYGARCAILHSYSIDAYYHQQNSEVKMFAYHDGGRHEYNAEIDNRLIVIGVNSLVNDFGVALVKFIQAINTDVSLRQRVANRIPRLIETMPI
ncbi:MAG: hypothetical protein KGI13_07785 [Betaproteobacteria bacterium]|nr:hypothetical protein [Betaproteobacteria bacterium]